MFINVSKNVGWLYNKFTDPKNDIVMTFKVKVNHICVLDAPSKFLNTAIFSFPNNLCFLSYN